MVRLRLTPLLLAGVAFAAPVLAEAPLARLATALADQIARVADGRPVEVGPVEDRTGRGAAFALDVRSLVLSRLGGRVLLAEAGPRLRIETVLTETPQRLTASARVLAQPEGSLVDLITASVATDPALLALSPAPPRAAPASIDVVGSNQTPPLDGPILDLAFLPDDRLVVLGPEALSLYRWEDGSLVREARGALPGPLETVRAPGGLLLPGDDAVWVLTSRSQRATLFAVEKGSRPLVERLQAAALPIPGSPDGLRYRPGTNLLEGTLPGLGPGPFLAFELSDPEVAVDADGQVRLASPDGPKYAGLRAGPALTVLWPGVLAAASAAPPGAVDSILVLAREGAELKLRETLPVSGAVRALAATARGTSVRLVAAVEDPGATRLLVLDLRRGSP